MVNALKTTTALLAVIFTATLLNSCGEKDTHDKVFGDLVTQMEALISTLETAKDKPSAEAAAKKLDEMVGGFEALSARRQALGAPDAETDKALKEKYDERIEDLYLKVTETMLMASKGNADVLQIFEKQMEKIGKAIRSNP